MPGYSPESILISQSRGSHDVKSEFKPMARVLGQSSTLLILPARGILVIAAGHNVIIPTNSYRRLIFSRARRVQVASPRAVTLCTELKIIPAPPLLPAISIVARKLDADDGQLIFAAAFHRNAQVSTTASVQRWRRRYLTGNTPVT